MLGLIPAMILSLVFQNCSSGKYASNATRTEIALTSVGQNNPEVPTTKTFFIGGTISGLTEDGLVLLNRIGNDLQVLKGSTTFQFSNPVQEGEAYEVSILSAPSNLNCKISSASGIDVNADINSVSVVCQMKKGVITSVSMVKGFFTYTGKNLNWLGPDGKAYKAGMNFFTPPVEDGYIGGYSNLVYVPGDTTGYLPGGASTPTYQYLCPADQQRYDSTVCTNAISWR